MAQETAPARIRTPDQRLRVFISSTLGELAEERQAARRAVEQLRLAPIMFELGARPHPPRALYRSYLEQSDVFVGIYWQRYGWVAPDMAISGLEDEYLLSETMPRLVYLKRPAPDMEPGLRGMLARLQDQDTTSYKPFRDGAELERLLVDDLAIMLAERFERSGAPGIPTRPSTNLPTPPSDFVGREETLAQLASLLGDDGVRLVTLTGSGGIGKTRLAIEAARAQLDRFEDGIFFSDLTEARAPDAAYATMLHAVPVADPGEDPPLEALKRGLRDRDSLLVLDNFEQVVAAAPGLAELLEHCPGLHALVTSREALRIRGERRFPVSPLSLPSGDGVRGLTAEAALDYEALRLFRDRAAAVRPDFEVTDADVADVTAICARLDALPLAIELAAARVNLFSVDELRARLDSHAHLLGSGSQDLPARQQTLHRAIEWSYELLTEAERTFFRFCSLFVDARVIDIEAAAARIESLGLDVIDMLASLVDKSLIRSISAVEGGARFSMLQTIRDYAMERLDEEPDFADVARRAHAKHYTEVAVRLRESAGAVGQEVVLTAVSSDLANLRTAWSHWVELGDVACLNDLLEPLWAYYEARGNYRAAIDLGEDLLRVLARQPESHDRLVDELSVEAALARSLIVVTGFSSESERRIVEVLDRASAAGQSARLFPALRSLSALHLMRSDFAKQAATASELLAIARRQRDPSMLCEAHLASGVAKMWEKDMPAALHHVEQAVQHGDRARPGFVRLRVGPEPRVLSHMVSGLIRWIAGYPEQARDAAGKGVDVAREINHPYSLAYGLFHSALLDLWAQDVAALMPRVEELLDVAGTHDYRIWEAVAHVLRGTARVAAGDHEDGLSEVDEGVALYEGLPTPPIFWPALLVIQARTNLMAGRADVAGVIAAEAERCVSADDPMVADVAITWGDVFLAGAPPAIAAAEEAYERAADLARTFGARMAELEAATRLARLWAGTPREEEAVKVVRDLLESFTEGFTMPQLIAAAAVVQGA